MLLKLFEISFNNFHATIAYHSQKCWLLFSSPLENDTSSQIDFNPILGYFNTNFSLIFYSSEIRILSASSKIKNILWIAKKKIYLFFCKECLKRVFNVYIFSFYNIKFYEFFNSNQAKTQAVHYYCKKTFIKWVTKMKIYF